MRCSTLDRHQDPVSITKETYSSEEGEQMNPRSTRKYRRRKLPMAYAVATLIMVTLRAAAFMPDGDTRRIRARLARVEADLAEHVTTCPCQVPTDLEQVLQRIPSGEGA